MQFSIRLYSIPQSSYKPYKILSKQRANQNPYLQISHNKLQDFCTFKKTKVLSRLYLNGWKHWALPVICKCWSRRCSSSAPRFVHFGIQPIERVIIWHDSKLINMLSMSWKARGTWWWRCAAMGVLNRAVERRLRQWLLHWTDLLGPEGLNLGIVGVCIVILKDWICRSTTSNLQIPGLLLSQLRMPCFNPEGKTQEQ